MPQVKATPNIDDLTRVRDATKDIVQHIVQQIKLSAPDAPESQPRFFFPNGVELLDISVAFGLTAKGIEVKIKIAGEKGVKASRTEVGEEIPGAQPAATS